MPLDGLPAEQPAVTENECNDQNSIVAGQTVVDGCPVLPKLQCHEVQMGQDARLLWTMKNPEGEPVDLDTCLTGCTPGSDDGDTFDAVSTPSCEVELRIRELSGYDPVNDLVHSVSVEVLDAEAGQVRAAALPEAVLRSPGVYLEEWGVFTADKRMLFSNQCCTFVRRGLFGLGSDLNKRNLGPPTIEEIRLSLRDNAAADNLLLDDIEFDAAEIAQAVLRPIQFWNEIPPPLRPVQTTKTFPFRELWMRGIQSNLLEIAAHSYRRNHLPYSAGGVSVDDKNKDQPYMAAAARLRQEFQDACRLKKIEINTSMFSGSIGSAYSGLFY